MANTAFDAATIEVWPAISNGAKLVIVNQQTLLHPQLLVDCYQANNITFSWLPTPIAEVLMKDNDIILPKCLKAIETAGQRLTVRPPAHWHVRVENSYGPTETTVIATSSVVSPSGSGLPDIGKPLSGIGCHVLDDHLNEVAQGATGELYISGIGVARGYINRAELTKEKICYVNAIKSRKTKSSLCLRRSLSS